MTPIDVRAGIADKQPRPFFEYAFLRDWLSIFPRMLALRASISARAYCGWE